MERKEAKRESVEDVVKWGRRKGHDVCFFFSLLVAHYTARVGVFLRRKNYGI